MHAKTILAYVCSFSPSFLSSLCSHIFIYRQHSIYEYLEINFVRNNEILFLYFIFLFMLFMYFVLSYSFVFFYMHDRYNNLMFTILVQLLFLCDEKILDIIVQKNNNSEVIKLWLNTIIIATVAMAIIVSCVTDNLLEIIVCIYRDQVYQLKGSFTFEHRTWWYSKCLPFSILVVSFLLKSLIQNELLAVK